MITTDAEMLWSLVLDNLDDHELKLVAADAYEEVGDTARAECLRWLARSHVRPCDSINFYGCSWWDLDTRDKQYGDRHRQHDPLSNLPGWLHSRLEPGLKLTGYGMQYFSQKHAMVALINAFVLAWGEGAVPKVTTD